MSEHPLDDRFVDAHTAAMKYKKSAQWFYGQAKRGLPHYRVGRSVRFRESDLDQRFLVREVNDDPPAR